VRLTTVGTQTLSDVSNAVFTIGYPTPLLTSPNSGTFEYSQPITIAWDVNSFNSSTVRLEHSVDSGLTWNFIANATRTTGSYSWTAPNITTNNFFIRVMNTLNLNVWDANDVPMVINKPVRFLSFQNATTLTGCQSFTLEVARSGNYSSILPIQYSIDGGTNWTNITTVSSGAPVNRTFNWTVPNINAPNVKFRAFFNNEPSWSDTAIANVAIVADYPITVSAPNTNIQLTPGQLTTLSWTNTNNVSGVYRIQLYNGSVLSSTIANNITGNNYVWTVPNTPGTDWRIRISDQNNTCRFDDSDVPFTIVPKTPLLTAPNGGEVWWAGQTQSITWDNSTFYNTVRIDYSLDNGFTWININSNVTNNGSFSWTLPWTTPRSQQAIVRVSDNSNLNIFDVSNNVFTINPAVRILTPNGGLELGACTNSSISFEHSPQIVTNNWRFRIEYSLDNGINWVALATNQIAQTNSLTTYNYSLPNSSTTQYTVRVAVAQNTSYNDVSDSLNTIKQAVTIIQPNFGGVLQVGSSYQVQWSSDGISNLYNLYYSTTGKTGPYSVIQLNYNTATNQYNWTVPNTATNNAYLVIQDATAACKTDTSDLAFIISPNNSQITVTAPNGGELLKGCEDFNITWTDISNNGPYTLAYSTDGANTFTTIANNVSGTSYNWVVPNISSTNVLVRVRSASNTTIFDLSNALFSISKGSVTAIPDTTICEGQTVQLLATGGNGSFTWTPSLSLNNSQIPNPIASPSTTTNYIATSNNNGCILSDTARVIVVPGGIGTPSVAITVSPSTGICSGSSVTFSAAATNGGNAPSYQWKINGNNVGNNSPLFTSSNISNNDVITCVMTSNAPCVSPNSATSNAISMTVFPTVAPAVSIAASSTSICNGANVLFTATPVNGGISPSYQWKLNGNIVGNNSNTLSIDTLSNNDLVVCEMTSNANCATPSIVS
jgi:hypothetical protein